MSAYHGDYHVHTRFSDGLSSVDGVCAAALRRGLREIAVTDHGLSVRGLALTPEKFERERMAVAEARKRYPGLSVLQGIEADIVGPDGSLDALPAGLDILLAGFHRFAVSGNREDQKNFVLYNGFFTRLRRFTPDIVERNTRAFVSALERYPIAILTHPGHLAPVDMKRVCSAAAALGTLIELNVKHMDLVRKHLRDMLETDCGFVVDSDAHSARSVGNFAEMDAFLSRYGVPPERIKNRDGRPEFRTAL